LAELYNIADKNVPKYLRLDAESPDLRLVLPSNRLAFVDDADPYRGNRPEWRVRPGECGWNNGEGPVDPAASRIPKNLFITMIPCKKHRRITRLGRPGLSALLVSQCAGKLGQPAQYLRPT
jgi:hypothetical protein